MRALLLCLIVFSSLGHAANYKYNELKMKDYDEMSAMVQSFIEKAQAADRTEGSNSEAVGILKEALKLILSRPDMDNMVAKLIPEIRKDLGDLAPLEVPLSQLADEALGQLKANQGSPASRATALTLLENLLAEIKPDISRSPKMRAIAERIRDAKLKIPRDVQAELQLQGMFGTRNPSEIAQAILKAADAQAKKQNKKD